MKTVVITGANRGIGLGFLNYYLSNGWQVIALSRSAIDQSTLNRNIDECFHNLTVNLLDESSINNTAKSINNLCNGIDLLINNAGVAEHEVFGEWSQAALTTNFQVNSVAPALLTQALSPQLNQHSKVIQLSSGLASIKNNLSPLEGFDSYCMSKAAVNILSRRLAFKLADKKIIVNAISPGWVKTDMGGPEAPATITEAVNTLTQTIEMLSMENSGKFLDENGKKIDW
ncbi:SDR family NAD(P)-dependent oxidoreductase [Pseudocolwellia agarivorans]|uniref:SDR family NAD(P)-dependent oxidoreductase n=1 Tax=Pseudocolwellia agarivorans TaxID=1911682 RepID=UPI0009867DC7|nr:SDR family NAD(P)-dependent oxidoreductase [Pseudocolwellia agarivorans]